MRTIRNILLGLAALTIGLSTMEAQNSKLHKKQKTTPKWESIGPANFSGRVLAIHVDSRNPQKIYAGTAGGGLWISDNNGVSWHRCKDFPGSVAVSAIVQDANGTVYVGTGEAYGLNDPGVVTNLSDWGIAGDGIYTTNDDIAFTLLTGSDAYKVVTKMVYNPSDNNIYIGTEIGLKVYSPAQGTIQNAHTDQKIVSDVSIGSDGTIIYSNHSTSNTADVLLKRSSAASFTSICGTQATRLPNNAGRISVAIAPSDPTVIYAYATNSYSAANQAHFEGVYKSTDQGVTWKKIYVAPSYEGPSGHPTKSSGLGYSCNAIAVSPDSASKVFVGTTRLYEGNEITLLNGDKIYSWMPVYGGKFYTLNYTHHGFFAGMSNGIIRAPVGTIFFVPSNRYLNNLQVYSFSIGNKGQILLSTQDHGSLYIENAVDSISQGTRLDNDYGIGINNTTSMLKSEAIFYADITGSIYRMASVNSDVQKPSTWFGQFPQLTNSSTSASTKDLARWFRSRTSTDQSLLGAEVAGYYANNVSPIAFWESINDSKSIDTITYIADITYAPNEDICVRSDRNSYPIWITRNDTLHKDSSIRIQDIVTSRFFLGGGSYKPKTMGMVGAPVFMTTNILDFNTTQEKYWSCIFRTEDKDEQVLELAVSEDGDHVFVLTKKRGPLVTTSYSIYRVSGFDTYREKRDIEVSNSVFDISSGVEDNNPNRKLKNDTLIYEGQIGSDFVTGDILSITLDPNNNNNLLYTTNAPGGPITPRISLITNALTASKDNVAFSVKDGSGLPDGAVYTAIVEMSDNKIAFIGTEKGVYKTTSFDASSPTWASYNVGIDANVPVFKLLQQTRRLDNDKSVYYTKLGERMEIDFPGVANTGIIYAATYGLGMFAYTEYHQPIVSIPSYPGGKMETKLAVYPNPVTNVVTVDFTLLKEEQVQLNIVDITGKVIISNNIGNREAGKNTETLDCSGLSSGMYFVTLKTNTQNKTAKIVVSK